MKAAQGAKLGQRFWAMKGCPIELPSATSAVRPWYSGRAGQPRRAPGATLRCARPWSSCSGSAGLLGMCFWSSRAVCKALVLRSKRAGRLQYHRARAACNVSIHSPIDAELVSDIGAICTHWSEGLPVPACSACVHVHVVEYLSLSFDCLQFSRLLICTYQIVCLQASNCSASLCHMCVVAER